MKIEALGKPAGCKLIRITAELSPSTEGSPLAEGIIQSISIRGDFFASPEEGFDRVEQRLPGIRAEELGASFDQYLKEEGVEAQGICGDGLAEVFNSALKREAL
ncbi:hypothetical protein AGMMS50267_15360 [Spirochaetia bacterium]|nr:hypothetical protein AGMMS50267_15360 [Spirochaetia bacterium]